MRNVRLIPMCVAAACCVGGHSPSGPSSSAARPPVAHERAALADAQSARRPEKLKSSYLPNALRLHEKVISGGEPAGEPAFAELAEWGVKTVISVDGAKPDVAAAKRHGLRYVHLPHGYDGIPAERAQSLAKAVRDLPGPIYIHCHHGQHRSPAAAAVACVSAGLIAPADALAVLETAGTSENYRGLYQAAAKARQLDDAMLDALVVEFQEVARIPAMAESMVEIEHTFDHVKQVAAAGWKRTPENPDIDPPHEALLLREHFTELLRSDGAPQQPERFRALLTGSEAAASELEAALRGASDAKPADRPLLMDKLDLIAQNCAACHREFRDVPLGEK